jgi:hypothetical protein
VADQPHLIGFYRIDTEITPEEYEHDRVFVRVAAEEGLSEFSINGRLYTWMPLEEEGDDAPADV